MQVKISSKQIMRWVELRKHVTQNSKKKKWCESKTIIFGETFKGVLN